jgi:hypothetical protein
MRRRTFLSSSVAAPALAGLSPSALFAQERAAPAASLIGRQYYELRRYHLNSGPQTRLTHAFLAEALIPALNRLGLSPVGAFDLYLGPETPTIYLLVPGNSLDALVTAESRLAQDQHYQQAGHAFLNAPAKEPPYDRVESSLMIAFEGHPKLTLPPHSASRVFQLRTYESPTNADHVRKVEMFNSGEYGVFERAGFWQVFYGDTLIGPRLPNLTYMLSFPDLGEMERMWKAFGADPEWKKLTGSPRFNYEDIVSNISNLILNPTKYSQI